MEGSQLWTEQVLWVFTRASVGSWSARVADPSGAPVGYADVLQSGLDAAIRVFDAAGAPQLTMPIRRQSQQRSWNTALDVLDPAGAQLGEISLVKFFNRRVTLALRAAGEELGRLKPVEKDRRFEVHDAAGNLVARVDRAASSGRLLKEEQTWSVSMSRPLPQPLDSLILGAGVGLNQIQHLAVG